MICPIQLSLGPSIVLLLSSMCWGGSPWFALRKKKMIPPFKEAIDVLDMIKSELERCRDFYEKDGPEICPAAPFIKKDMDFQFYSVFR